MMLPPQLKQAVFAGASLLNLMVMGMVYGYVAILSPALLKPTSEIPMDKYQASWIASMSGISGILPVFIVGPMMHICGRRVTNFCVTTTVLVGWVLTATAPSLPLLFIGRFLHSIGAGALYFYAVCIGEFASPSNRCLLLNFKILSVSLGIGIIHLFGNFLHWRHLALVPVVPCFISLLITFFWPETPDWLVSRGRYEEAFTVFMSLRDESVEAQKEIRKMIEVHKITTKRESNENESLRFKDLLRQFRSKVLWRPVILLVCGILVPELGGRHFFPSYSLELAAHISGNKGSGFLYTYIIDGISIVSSCCSFWLVKRFPRRKLLLTSGYFAVFLLLAASIIMFIRDRWNITILLYPMITLLAIYLFTTYCAIFAVSYILMGELFPLEYRPVGSIINSVLSSIITATIIKIIPILKDTVGVDGMLFSFGFCMLSTMTYFFYDLPETKHRTLHDIGEYFRGNSPKVPVSSTLDKEQTDIIFNT